MDAADLARHRTDRCEPVTFTLGEATLALSPPVSQAGLAGLALRDLALHRPVASGPARVHLLVEAMEAAFQHRRALATMPWHDIVTRVTLLSGGAARRLGGARGTSHTSAVAVADDDGLVVSLLVSVFHEFGSAAYVPEVGFVLNDRMVGLEVAPPVGDRPLHTLSPAILTHAGEHTALATPGADAQVQVLAQVIDGLLTDDMALTEAIDRPRWRLQGEDLVVERSMDAQLRHYLRSHGHSLIEVEAGDRSFGSLVAAAYDDRTSTCSGAADLRRESTSGAA